MITSFEKSIRVNPVQLHMLKNLEFYASYHGQISKAKVPL